MVELALISGERCAREFYHLDGPRLILGWTEVPTGIARA